VDAAAEELRARIQDGTFPAGSRLPPERTLVKELAISRAVLREALASLEALGMLEARTTRGRYVAGGGSPGLSSSLVTAWLHQHVTEIAEFDEIRALVESHAVRGLSEADAFDAARRARMVLVDQEAAIARRDPVQAARADMEFHRLLSSYSKNALLLSLANGFIAHMWPATLAVYSLPEAAERSLGEHREIVADLAAGNAERAAQRIVAHQSQFSGPFSAPGAATL
jgi:DNA-binding FadR family transcriptional regulator